MLLLRCANDVSFVVRAACVAALESNTAKKFIRIILREDRIYQLSQIMPALTANTSVVGLNLSCMRFFSGVWSVL